MIAAVLSLLPAMAQAQNYPNRPVHILVPFAAGGAVDVIARTLGQALAKSWGQQPVIENRPGAGGTIGSQALTQAPPDGHTLLVGQTAEIVANPILMKDAGCDVEYQVWPGMPHVFQLLVPVLPEANAAVEEIGKFVQRVLP